MVPRPESIKEKLFKLMSDKEQLESRINSNGEILAANDNVGMCGPLVDVDGYPRNDIDVYKVRQARHEIICLQNDHKELMKQIEQLIHKLHKEAAESERQELQSHLENRTSHMQIDDERAVTNGFHSQNGSASESSSTEVIATINLVSPGSPAEDAGLRIGDKIIQFGTINANNFKNNLNEIGAIVRHMQNQRIIVKVKRDEEILDMILVPKTWRGRGLLGCNIVVA